MIILTGVAGAGKSLQGRLLADEGYVWISTGELFRLMVTGKRRQEMLEGKLLSDDEVIKLVDETIKTVPVEKEIVLDGFPRTIVQSDWLLDEISSERLKLRVIFNFVISRDVVKHRLVNRGRQDDNAEAIEKRFLDYENTTLPILDYLRKKHITIFDIDADQDPQKVHEQIMQYLNSLTA